MKTIFDSLYMSFFPIAVIGFPFVIISIIRYGVIAVHYFTIPCHIYMLYKGFVLWKNYLIAIREV